MKSLAKFVGSTGAVLFAVSETAWANFTVPEPGALSLVGVAVVGALVASRFFTKKGAEAELAVRVEGLVRYPTDEWLGNLSDQVAPFFGVAVVVDPASPGVTGAPVTFLLQVGPIVAFQCLAIVDAGLGWR